MEILSAHRWMNRWYNLNQIYKAEPFSSLQSTKWKKKKETQQCQNGLICVQDFQVYEKKRACREKEGLLAKDVSDYGSGI